MAIYEFAQDSIRHLEEITFGSAGMHERRDLQRLLRERIEVIAPGTLVISEEFREWEDSQRRIDLLAIDKEANLVVIELKRTEDSAHTELQAIRYAAMVSTMTFEKAADTLSEYLTQRGTEHDATQTILDFLGWTSATITNLRRMFASSLPPLNSTEKSHRLCCGSSIMGLIFAASD